MKHYYPKYFALVLSLILMTSFILAGCNRSATEGILPEDSTVEEVAIDEMSGPDSSMEESESSMQALLDDDMDDGTNTNEGNTTRRCCLSFIITISLVFKNSIFWGLL